MEKYSSNRKGIILAGGTGTRLYPLTQIISKQLLPVYDKPMIFYPLSTLMLAGIQEIAIITTAKDQYRFQELLGDGSQWGLRLEYIIQPSADGLAQAFILAEDFIGNSSVALILGDNLFYGNRFSTFLQETSKQSGGATILGYHVSNPEDYGVVEMDEQGKALSVEEKPWQPKSNYAITGLYFFDNRVVKFAKTIKPSDRGELEITSIIDCYLKDGSLNVAKLSRGTTWLDTGTHQNLLHAPCLLKPLKHDRG